MGRPILRTPLCEALGIEYPIFLAGMGAGVHGGAAGPELVAAVSEAGGLGVLGGTGQNLDDFFAAIAEIRRLTKKPFGVDLLLPSVGQAPPDNASPPDTGAYDAFVEQTLEALDLPRDVPAPAGGGPFGGEGPAERERRLQRHVAAIIQGRPAVFAAGLGSPKAFIPDLHAAGITVFGLVGNVKTARRVKADGVDVVVAQGHEAGGHTGRVGTFALVPQVVDAVAPTPVVLAGGVADGRGVAAALALGAQAVWVGTAFLATPEANISPTHRQSILDASEEDTRVTRLYSGKPARAVKNPMVEAWEASGLAALPMGAQGRVSGRLMAAAAAAGREDLGMHLGGQIAGAVREVRPAHVIVEEMVREAVDVLSTLTRERVTFAFA